MREGSRTCAYVTAPIVIRFLLKIPGSPYYVASHAAFALLVALTRWMDTIGQAL